MIHNSYITLIVTMKNKTNGNKLFEILYNIRFNYLIYII